MRSDPALRFWGGETNAVLPGVTLIRAGDHFPGGTVLHWRDGAEGQGALLSGDILQVTPRRKCQLHVELPEFDAAPAPGPSSA